MTLSFVRWTCALGLAIGLSGEGAVAQEAPAAPVTPTAPAGAKAEEVKISLLAIGDRPEITLTTTTQGSFYNKPEPSEAPPDQLFVKAKGEYKMFMLGLNTPMDSITHPGNTELKLYESKGDADEGVKEPYCSIPLPKEKVDLTIFVLRNAAAKSWRSKPQVFPFKNDLQSFPPGSVRVINFSSVSIKVQLGSNVFDLGAKGSKVVPFPTAAKGIMEYKIGALVPGQPLMVADSSKTYYPGMRMNMVVYDSDGKKRSHAVEHVVFSERPQE